MDRSTHRENALKTFTENDIADTTRALESALVPFNGRFPGSAGERQPVHTVYGGAHLFKSDTTKRLGETAKRILQEYGRDAKTFAVAIGISEALADRVWQRVGEKLQTEPVEDFRIDFEDGYGNRPDATRTRGPEDSE